MDKEKMLQLIEEMEKRSVLDLKRRVAIAEYIDKNYPKTTYIKEIHPFYEPLMTKLLKENEYAVLIFDLNNPAKFKSLIFTFKKDSPEILTIRNDKGEKR